MDPQLQAKCDLTTLASKENEEKIMISQLLEQLQMTLAEEEDTRTSRDEVIKSLGYVNRELLRKVLEIKRLGEKIAELEKTVETTDESNTASSSSCTHRQDDIEQAQLTRKEDIEGRTPTTLILPEEVWETVFWHVTDVNDFENCKSTCQLFKNILFPCRTVWLFQQVFARIFPNLDKKSVLNCRLVCKSWAEGVDDFLGNHPSLRPHSDKAWDPRFPQFVTPRLKWYTISNSPHYAFQANRMLRKMGNHEKNPFIGRSVAIIEFPGAPLEQFWNDLYFFLNVFGAHIWYVYFRSYIEIENRNTKNCHALMRFLATDVYSLVPNMRKIYLGGPLVRDCEKSPESSLSYSATTTCSKLQNYLDHRSALMEPSKETEKMVKSFEKPAAAPRLETLHISDVICGTNQSILTVPAMNYHKQLKCLHIKIPFWEELSHLGWTNLTELHITGLGSGNLGTIMNVNAPRLQKLGLGEIQDARMLLEILNKLCKTTQLSILRVFGSYHLSETYIPLHLWAPLGLATLEIEDSSSAGLLGYGASFLLRFPFLQNINLFRRVTDDRTGSPLADSRNEIYFPPLSEYNPSAAHESPIMNTNIDDVIDRSWLTGDVNGMYGFNIWELLPRLKILTFQDKVYTKLGREAYLRNYNS